MKVNKEQLRQSIETILINSVWTSEDTSHQIMEAVEPLIIALEVLQEERAVKKLSVAFVDQQLRRVTSEEISFSRFVELINEEFKK